MNSNLYHEDERFFNFLQTCGMTKKSYTYGKSRENCTLFANALLSQLNLREGDVLGLLLPNTPEYVFAIHGAMEAGIIVTFINPLYTSGKTLKRLDLT